MKNILFQLRREIAIGKGSRTELRLGLVQIPVVLFGTSGCQIILDTCLRQHGYLCHKDN